MEEQMTRKGFFGAVAGAVAVASGGTIKADQVGASEVKRGGLYSIEIPSRLSAGAMQHIHETLKPIADRHGVEFIVLDGGATMRDPSAPVVNIVNGPIPDPNALANEIIRRLRAGGVKA